MLTGYTILIAIHDGDGLDLRIADLYWPLYHHCWKGDCGRPDVAKSITLGGFSVILWKRRGG